MNRHFSLGLFAITLVTIAAIPNGSVAQGASLKDQLVGTCHLILTRTDAPKYASGDIARPSPDEAMAIASGGSVAYTGTYTVDEGTKTIHVNIEASTFPNLVGAPNQRRIVTSITADEMKFTNPRTLAGLTLEIVWKRAK